MSAIRAAPGSQAPHGGSADAGNSTAIARLAVWPRQRSNGSPASPQIAANAVIDRLKPHESVKTEKKACRRWRLDLIAGQWIRVCQMLFDKITHRLLEWTFIRDAPLTKFLIRDTEPA